MKSSHHNLLTPRMDYKVISPSIIQYIFNEKRDEKRGNIKEQKLFDVTPKFSILKLRKSVWQTEQIRSRERMSKHPWITIFNIVQLYPKKQTDHSQSIGELQSNFSGIHLNTVSVSLTIQGQQSFWTHHLQMLLSQAGTLNTSKAECNSAMFPTPARHDRVNN